MIGHNKNNVSHPSRVGKKNRPNFIGSSVKFVVGSRKQFDVIFIYYAVGFKDEKRLVIFVGLLATYCLVYYLHCETSNFG
jgi:hypothetical protein